MASTITFVPHQPSTLARTTSPFKEPRTPPHPRNTAKFWDEYERKAVENARRRETTAGSPSSLQVSRSPRLSNGTVYDIIKSYDPYSSPRIPSQSPVSSAAASPQFGFEFSTPIRQKVREPIPSTTVAICKTCKQEISSASGICEQCKRTIVLPPAVADIGPPLSPSSRNFASTDLPRLQKRSSRETTPKSSSPKRKSQRPPSVQLFDLPIRLSSLKPPPVQESSQIPAPGRSRKTSLTDPNEPFLRLQTARKPLPLPYPRPASSTTPPSSSHSHTPSPRTRPPSLANITTPPRCINSSQHTSATPSELSSLYPYISNSTSSPPSVCRASYTPHNTTSAWDDWDSEQEEKVGLVSYWRGRKWRGSRGSLGGPGGRRDSAGGEDSAKEEGKRKRRGFVRVISCGCGEE